MAPVDHASFLPLRHSIGGLASFDQDGATENERGHEAGCGLSRCRSRINGVRRRVSCAYEQWCGAAHAGDASQPLDRGLQTPDLLTHESKGAATDPSCMLESSAAPRMRSKDSFGMARHRNECWSVDHERGRLIRQLSEQTSKPRLAQTGQGNVWY